ncbi:Pentatricopeptide repeat-containing protein [Platanthera guangdongensis]|uniref:Pentatricopeptide repeat-containing protein n=1 Tax=Platanthera guangdongensis TaxID=2320717 RepID=A0ABR2MVM9_9ASPA
MRLAELQPDDSDDHALLSNAYAKAGKWSEVVDVRKFMSALTNLLTRHGRALVAHWKQPPPTAPPSFFRRSPPSATNADRRSGFFPPHAAASFYPAKPTPALLRRALEPTAAVRPKCLRLGLRNNVGTLFPDGIMESWQKNRHKLTCKWEEKMIRERRDDGL